MTDLEVTHMLFEVAYQWVRANIKKEDGQAMAEYGLLLALIAVVCIVALTAIGLAVAGKFGDVQKALGG